MTKPQRLRMSMDITMTILSVILMGGNFLFPAEIVHEILGLGFARIAHLLASHWYYVFYVAAYRPSHGTIFSECCSKKPSAYYSCPDLPLRSLLLHRPRSLEVSYSSPAVFLL